MKILKRILPLLLVFILLANTITAEASSKIKLNKSKATIYVGKSTTLKMSGTTKKVTWKSSNKKVVTVNSKGKVTGKKKGKATITATVNKKNYKSVVTVKKKAVAKEVKKVEVIEVTAEDNVKKLVDYIETKGFDAPKSGYRTIRYEDKYKDGLGEAIRLLPDDLIQFSSMADMDLAPKGYYGNIVFTIDKNEFKVIKFSTMSVSVDKVDFREGVRMEVNVEDIAKVNSIKFSEDEAANKSANKAFDIVLEKLNTFMTETVGIGLQDIGFINYK